MSFTEKLQQKAEALKGTAKEKLGGAMDSQRLRGEGEREHGEAKVRQAGERLKGAGQSARDTFR